MDAMKQQQQQQQQQQRKPDTKQDAPTAASSLHDWLRRHPRERVLVNPLMWTRLQLELARCSFDDTVCLAPLLTDMHFSWGLARHLREAKLGAVERCLADTRHATYKLRNVAVREMLTSGRSPLRQKEKTTHVPLLVDGYPRQSLPCMPFHRRHDGRGPSKHAAATFVAHLDHGYLERMRTRAFGLHKTPLHPVTARIAAALKKRATPAEPMQDPYFAALLIAMAQQLWWQVARTALPHPAFVTPQLLYTADDANFIYLYRANIARSLVDLVERPAVAPRAHPPPLCIHTSAIPLRPVATLRDRLLAVLLRAPDLPPTDDDDEAAMPPQPPAAAP